MSESDAASALAGKTSTPRRRTSNLSMLSLSSSLGNAALDKPAAVIEIGTKILRIGFAGEFEPRSMRRNTRVAAGQEMTQMNERQLCDLFNDIFTNDLLCNSTERRVVIVESVLYPTKFRQVLLERLRVPAILFVPGHLTATFPFNTKDALVVDCGFRETAILPVLDGVTVLSSLEVSSISGRRLEEKVEELLREHGWTESADGQKKEKLTEADCQLIRKNRILEDICCRYIFSTSSERSRALANEQTRKALNPPEPKPVRIQVKDRYLVVPGFIREMACEIVMSREQENKDESSLPLLIHRVISKLPIDCRRKMFSNILVVGGLSRIPGFLARLKEELHNIGSEKELKCSDVIKFYQLGENPFAHLFAAWTGASMYSSLQNTVSQQSLTREKWLEARRLPDWTDFTDAAALRDDRQR
ncbi:hypothetical protein WR25_00900 [Diploscapter pachys]|uniref:Actin-related protein 10 n=1 Tax=Diploscapter pachys TaxID=2018661 RepID=A0A2A2KVN8_9BILA|nr:hypothetical protein WR25_00900 [Diploscapter pachys]